MDRKLRKYAISDTTMVLICVICISASLICIQNRQFVLSDIEETHISPSVLVDYHTGKGVIQRAVKMLAGPLSHPFFKKKLLDYRFVYPNKRDFFANISYLETNCATLRDGPTGLSCRVDAAYFDFLERYRDVPWYFRANDDTYINPEVLYNYVQDLNLVIDPFKHIVMKNLVNPWEFSSPLGHGGTGWLLSHAAIQFFKDKNILLTEIQQYSLGSQDDTAHSNVAWRIWETEKHWNDNRFVAVEFSLQETKNSYLYHSLRNYTSVTQKCNRSCINFPLNRVVSFHTNDIYELVRLATTSEFAADNVFLSYCTNRQYTLCIDSVEYRNTLLSIDLIAQNTPPVVESDIPMPFMNDIDKECQKGIWFSSGGRKKPCRIGRGALPK